MEYKHMIVEGSPVFRIDDPAFAQTILGRLFKTMLAEKFPFIKEPIIVVLKDSNGIYTAIGETPMVNINALNNIPENSWTTEVWGD